MYLGKYSLIFLHLPKTGGNSVSRALLPFSDDRMYVGPRQDGVDTFGIQGRATQKKHARLSSYEQTLGNNLLDVQRVAITLRDPVERAVSYYFSPHRWKRRSPGNGNVKILEPKWSFNDFCTTIEPLASLHDMLEINGQIRLPDFVLFYTHLNTDVHRLAVKTGIPLPAGSIPHANVSRASYDFRQELCQDDQVNAAVRERFSEDYKLIDTLKGKRV